MRPFFESVLALLRQEELISVGAGSDSQLVLRHKRSVTVFDATSRLVRQNGKVVAVFGSIREVLIRKITNEDGPVVWCVLLQLDGIRSVQVGRSTEDASASIAGARIATITGAPVRVSAA